MIMMVLFIQFLCKLLVSVMIARMTMHDDDCNKSQVDDCNNKKDDDCNKSQVDAVTQFIWQTLQTTVFPLRYNWRVSWLCSAQSIQLLVQSSAVLQRGHSCCCRVVSKPEQSLQTMKVSWIASEQQQHWAGLDIWIIQLSTWPLLSHTWPWIMAWWERFKKRSKILIEY